MELKAILESLTQEETKELFLLCLGYLPNDVVRECLNEWLVNEGLNPSDEI